MRRIHVNRPQRVSSYPVEACRRGEMINRVFAGREQRCLDTKLLLVSQMHARLVPHFYLRREVGRQRAHALYHLVFCFKTI
jgi:hypothetical protein